MHFIPQQGLRQHSALVVFYPFMQLIHQRANALFAHLQPCLWLHIPELILEPEDFVEESSARFCQRSVSLKGTVFFRIHKPGPGMGMTPYRYNSGIIVIYLVTV